jgi:signal transduction histidine kinase
MVPIRNPYLNALIEIERRLLFCQSAHACYTAVIERVGVASGAAHACLVELNFAVTNASTAVFVPSLQTNAQPSIQSVQLVATWSDTKVSDTDITAAAIDGAMLLAEPELSHWFMRLQQGDVIQQTHIEGSATEQQVLDSYGIGAVLIVPLMVHQQVQGAIVLIHRHPHRWETSELDIWQGVALILAAKLEQLQSTSSMNGSVQALLPPFELESALSSPAQRWQKRLKLEALLRQITDRVRASLDEAQILQATAQELAIGLNTYSCQVGQLDWTQGTSTIAYEFTPAGKMPTVQGLVLEMSEHLDLYSELLRGHCLQFCWIVLPVHLRSLNQPVAVLCCPIMHNGTAIGEIWLYNQADTYFDPEVIWLIEQVAHQCAIAIPQARLYQAAQAQVRKLEQLNALKDEFLNTVSHELRSPMANIEMAIQMLELLLFPEQETDVKGDSVCRQPAIPDCCSSDLHHSDRCPSSVCDSTYHSTDRLPARYFVHALPHPAAFQQSVRYFRMLQDECIRETKLINDLLDLSRLEAGTEPIVLTPINLQVWIPHVLEPFLERARCQAQRLQVEISDTVPLVSIDLRSLERILTELVHNACKYTPAGENIRVMVDYVSGQANAHSRADRPNATDFLLPRTASPLVTTSQLKLQVCNSGIEIPAADLPRIFDKFYRIPSPDLWQYGGTGLGLALVKRLAEHLGAKIWVNSSNNQVTFTLTLPLEPSIPSVEQTRSLDW